MSCFLTHNDAAGAAAGGVCCYGDGDAGTIFLELWKRKQSTLAYEWDVNSFESSEPDRPQFVGTVERQVCDIGITNTCSLSLSVSLSVEISC